MPVYRFKAYDASGKTVAEQLTASSREELMSLMESRKLYPVLISETLDRKDLKADLFQKRISLQEISFFCRQLYALFHAGVPIPECINTIAVQTDNPKFKRIILGIKEKLEEGNTLSKAVSEYSRIFPRLLVTMIEAGETAGFLEGVLLRMAVFYEKEHRVRVRIKAAALYPKFLGILSVIMVFFMLLFVMPSFANMFEAAHVAIPPITRAFIALGYWAGENIAAVILLCMTLPVLLRVFKSSGAFQRAAYFLDWIVFILPMVRDASVKRMTARFAGALSMLLKSGIPMIPALEIAERVIGNRHGMKSVRKVREKVDGGSSLAQAIGEIKLFPPLMEASVRTGEGSGSLDEVLEHMSDYYEEELDKSLDRMLKLLEPLMIVLMAAVIGTIVIAMILPMFDMVTAIS